MNKLMVYHDRRQSVKTNDSFSPSAGKPDQVFADWQRFKLPIEVCRVKPLTASEIAIAHDPKYVYGVLTCQKSNGFGNRSIEVASSLPWTTGSMFSAALGAIKHQTMTASLTSGFHHATYERGGGFCTFSGLMIAALKLKLGGHVEKIGIIDLDMHYGNGTQQIIEHFGVEKWVSHYTFGKMGITSSKADLWLDGLADVIRGMFSDCGVILYQAGADPHINDPLGGVLTDAQLRRRDDIVFSTAAELGIPVAFNLAGGYQTPIQKVLKIHRATAKSCLTILNRRTK